MKFMIMVDTTIKKSHVYEVEAPDKATAQRMAERTFELRKPTYMRENVEDFKFVEATEDDDNGREIYTYTIDESGWCCWCAGRFLIDHTLERFDCSCECHDEEANEYEEMWKEACDKDD